MSEIQSKFQQLLRELFQFDLADLDFGIYRIMNHKRQVIERWITEDLPKAVEEELRKGALAEQQQAQQALEEARQRVLETLGEDALDAEGNLAEPYHNTKVGREYLEAQMKAAHAQPAEALEAQVYNHLYTFFSRYYQDGDFISKRRYSKKERYAIPYNGEEVYLYWANHDQYYVKTAEHFTDYTWKAPGGVTVHFKLQAANVEVNNVKGEKRFFLPVLDGMTWDAESRTLTIPFHYRPLAKQEEITYGSRNQQEKIIQEALEQIPARFKGNPDALAALTAERKSVSYLEHHLRQYTARNTRDFFIHKDLKGFLSRELDFYLKNEVLNLDELEAAGEHVAEGWFQLMRLIKRIGNHIIDFLAQIEDFQKALWEKKKFVTETFWCITVGHIPEDFYPEIAANEAQWEEWKKLGFISGDTDDPENADVLGNTNAPGNADVLGNTDVSVNTDIPGNADVSSASGNAHVTTASPAASSSPLPLSETSATSTQHKGWHSRGYLPHFDAGGVFQFITFRLHDSVPASVIERWKQELGWHEGLPADSKEAVELRKRIEKYADEGQGNCYLRDERIARLVQDALKHFDGERYRLVAWCIMPNHVHVLIQVLDASLSKIVQSWKSYTAHQANKILGRTGQFWAPDYFDRYIRDEKHFEATIRYILWNPVKAGLADTPEKWPWCGYGGGNTAANSGGEVRSEESGGCEGNIRAALPGCGRGCGRDVRAPRVAFLKAHPSLVLDTRHFSQDFTDRLLASFENLDEMTDGLLVHSENWQALNLLLEKYRERVKCVHIDPPYNTEASGFLYKNDYRHSSWLSMMRDRSLLSLALLSANGTFLCHIDEYEFQRLNLLLEQLFGYVGTAIWDKLNPMMGAKALATQHEYIFFCSSEARAFFIRPENVKKILAKAASIVSKHGKVTEEAQKEFTNWVRQVPGLSGGERAYQYMDEHGRVYRLVAMTWPNPNPPPPEFFKPLIHPITGKPCPVPSRGWSLSPKTMQKLIERGEIVFGPDETTQPQRKVYLSEKKSLSSVIRDGARGKKELESLGLDFTYSHPSSLYVKLIEAGLEEGPGEGWVLDFFAGSGTTGHAVINLNREDGGRRKFILVEMGEYFDTVLLPRIKKVTFTPEWKDGKPKRMATQEEFERGPRIVKVIRLESYEDALNNITFDEESGQKALDLFGDEYLLRYMLKWETKKSETFLDVAQLQSPFSYKLRIHRDGETREQAVDLPETFAYLIGLDVETRKVYYDGDRRYLVQRGATRDGRKVAVIWRETKGWAQADYERDAQFVAEQKLTEDADEVFVNGDSYIEGARSLDGVFKARLFGQEG